VGRLISTSDPDVHSVIVLFFLSVSSVVTNYSTNEFYLVRDLLSWADAQRFCQNNFTDLASLHPPEQEDIFNMGLEGLWIGLSQLNQVWSWVDLSQVDTADWAPGEPASTGNCSENQKYQEGHVMSFNCIQNTDTQTVHK
uniref:C-type lectin domain-containing protein n=1 Tax=Erpetoichthys calabaricus TaxID=27687 RepID=A0A8C4RL91_ERPCA